MGFFGSRSKESNKPEMSQKMRRTMDDMLAMAADETLDAEIIEAGRQSMKQKLDDLGVEYNSVNLSILKAGMEFMMIAEKKSQEADKDVSMPVLITVAKLMKVERDLEESTKQK